MDRADDYLIKPFVFAVLVARVRALLRRRGKNPARAVLRASGSASQQLDQSHRQSRPAAPRCARCARAGHASADSGRSPFDGVARDLARDLTWQDTAAVVLDSCGGRIVDVGTVTTSVSSPTPDVRTLAHAFAGQSTTYLRTADGQDTLAVVIAVRYPRSGSPVAGVIPMTVIAGGDLSQRVILPRRKDEAGATRISL